ALTKELSSEARKTATAATSSGVANRFTVVLATKSSTTAGMSKNAAVAPVRTRPGAMAFTRMPAGPSSMAATCVSMLTPALAVQYADMPAEGCTAFNDATVMIEPDRGAVEPGPAFEANIDRAACFTVRNTPVRHRSMMRCH